MRANKKPGDCRRCGIAIEVGTGYEINEWDEVNKKQIVLVECLAPTACFARRELALQEADAKRKRTVDRLVALRTFTAKMLDESYCPDFGAGASCHSGSDRVYLLGKDRVPFGGGHWVDIEPASAPDRKIWYVVNNSAVNDDRTLNNYFSSGQGAIARWLPWSTQLELEVRILDVDRPDTPPLGTVTESVLKSAMLDEQQEARAQESQRDDMREYEREPDDTWNTGSERR